MASFYTNAFLFHDSIFLRGFEDGKRFQRTIACRPYLFVNSQREDLPFKTLKGKTVERRDFATPREARDYIKAYENTGGFDIYGMTQWLYPFLNDKYPGEIDYDPKLISVVNIDIEVAADNGFPEPSIADKPITAITIKKNETYVVLGCGDFVTDDPNIKYIKCEDESRLLLKFLDVWRSEWLSPDVVTGWNIDGFDIPYIVNRIRRILGHEVHKKLSPWGMVEERNDQNNREEVTQATSNDY